MEYTTRFGSLDSYEKGGVEIIDDDPSTTPSPTCSRSPRWRRRTRRWPSARTCSTSLEVIRAEGTSGWRTCAHDEFVLCMDGEVTVELVKPTTPLAPAGKEGSVAVDGEPEGVPMGTRLASAAATWRCCRAARPTASKPAAPSVSCSSRPCLGDDTVERWAEICLS